MARSRSASNALKFIGAGAAAIIGGIAIGYLFGGAHTARPVEQAVSAPQPAPPLTAPRALISPPNIHPRAANGNYTAPGAPQISIAEEKQPVLHRVRPPSQPLPDSEATQEAPPPTPDATATPDASSQDNGPGTSAPTDSGISSTSPSSGPAPSSPPAKSADPDFEHVNGGPAPNPGAGQLNTGQVNTGQSNTGKDSGKVQFRVQTGAYSDESSARSAADLLRGQGFSTSTRSELQGDHMIYKVQVGAYRSKNGATKAADDLQKKGYPAYVSPISP